MKTAWLMIAVATCTGVALSGCGVLDTIKARGLARDGNELYRQYDYRGAIAKYIEARALDPEIPNLYLNLGYAYFSIYDPAAEAEADQNASVQAVAAFDEHLKRVPEDENARNFQIKILLKAAPYDKSLSDRAYRTFLELLEKNPSDKEARQYLVTLFIDCKRYDDAVKFFEPDLQAKPDDVETMKILAIIADKSNRVQESVDWYWKRAEVTQDPEKRGVLFYEVGTYAWNLLHYTPDRVPGVAALKLADQGIEACLTAMKLKDKYAEAMIYANLLYLKRMGLEPDDTTKYFDSAIAYDLRSLAGQIMAERKKEKEGGAPGAEPGGAPGSEAGTPEGTPGTAPGGGEGAPAGGAPGTAPDAQKAPEGGEAPTPAPAADPKNG